MWQLNEIMDALHQASLLEESTAHTPLETGVRAGVETAAPTLYYGRISIDSRTLKKGQIFIPIKGDRFDGHDYISQAIDRGAAMIIHHQKHNQDALKNNNAEACSFIHVRDSFKALIALASYRRKQVAQNKKTRIVAITGSIGKTTTKEIFRTILGAYGRCYATLGNLNNHIGLPLSMANMPANTEFGIFELGMSNPGEIVPLSHLLNPDDCVITKIAPAHIESFDDIYGIAREKASIASGMHPNGTCFILPAQDDDLGDYLMDQIKQHNRAFMTGISEKPLNSLLKKADLETSNHRINHVVKQSLSVVFAYLEHHGIEKNEAFDVIPKIMPFDGRGNTTHIHYQSDCSVSLVNDAYNANPSSMKQAIETWAKDKHPHRKIIILGDMLELGDKSDDYHAHIIHQLHDLNDLNHDHDCDTLFYLVGPCFHKAYEVTDTEIKNKINAALYPDHTTCLKKLLTVLTNHDKLYIKASNGIGLWKICNALMD